jgi:hypothetical protein
MIDIHEQNRMREGKKTSYDRVFFLSLSLRSVQFKRRK